MAAAEPPLPADITAAVTALRQAVTGDPHGPWLGLARRRIAMLLGHRGVLAETPPTRPAGAADRFKQLPAWPTSPAFGADDRAVLAFTEQFVIDVAGVTHDDRAAAAAALDGDLFGFTQGLYILEVLQRGDLALAALSGVDPGWAAGPRPGPTRPRWPAIETFLRVVARLDALDPVTAELVRLRGARVHGCRVCQSRRSRAAWAAAGGPDAFDQVDRGRFTPREEAALALTDAVVSQPAGIDAGLTAAVAAAFGPAARAEIVLDVLRNAANKIAVALGADAPTVTDGVEPFDLDGDGNVVVVAG